MHVGLASSVSWARIGVRAVMYFDERSALLEINQSYLNASNDKKHQLTAWLNTHGGFQIKIKDKEVIKQPSFMAMTGKHWSRLLKKYESFAVKAAWKKSRLTCVNLLLSSRMWIHILYHGIITITLRLFRCRSKKTSKFRVTGLCAGNSPEFTGAQRASNAKNVSLWWRHHVNKQTGISPEWARVCQQWAKSVTFSQNQLNTHSGKWRSNQKHSKVVGILVLKVHICEN